MNNIDDNPNRLILKFNKRRKTKADGKGRVDTNSIRNTIYQFLHIKVSKEAAPLSDKLDFFIAELNNITEQTLSLFSIGNDDSKKINPKIQSERKSKPRPQTFLSSLMSKITAGITIGGLGLFALFNIKKINIPFERFIPKEFNIFATAISSLGSLFSIGNDDSEDGEPKKSMLAGLNPFGNDDEQQTVMVGEEEYPVNEYGEPVNENNEVIDIETGIPKGPSVSPEEKDNVFKQSIEKLKGVGNMIEGKTNALDKIVTFFSRGGFLSLADLLFDSARNSALVNFFKDNLKRFSTAIYNVFTDFIGGIHRWVQENVVNFVAPVYDKMKAIKNAISDKVSSIFKRERTAPKLYKNDEDNSVNRSGFLFADLAQTIGGWFSGIKDTRNWKIRKPVDENKPQDDEPSFYDKLYGKGKEAVESVSGVIQDATGDGLFSSLGGTVDLATIQNARVFQLPNGKWASDHPVMNAFIAIESMGDAQAQRSGSQYIGLLQFGDSARKTVGLSRADSYNAVKNFEAGKRYVIHNAKQLIKRGIPLTPANLYLAHQQGVGGLSTIYKHAKNGTSPGPGTTLRTRLDANHGKGMSPAQFLQFWQKNIEKRHQSFIDNYGAGIHLKGALHNGFNQVSNNANPDTTTNEASAVEYLNESGSSDTGQVIQSSGQASNQLTTNSPPVKAARMARSRAHGTTIGFCAKYVRIALQQGGGYRFDGQASAFQYHTNNTLSKSRPQFSQIDIKTPVQIGDVMVIDKIPGHIHGHIQIWDGRAWISDFIQSGGGPVYGKKSRGVALYRDSNYMNGASIIPKQWQNYVSGGKVEGNGVLGDPGENMDSPYGEAKSLMDKAKDSLDAVSQAAMAAVAIQHAGMAKMLEMAGLDFGALVAAAGSGEVPSGWEGIINKDIDEDFANE